MTKNTDQDTPVKQRGNEENISANNENYSKGEHPNSKANLKPFPKGVSGNPLGRPHKFVKLTDGDYMLEYVLQQLHQAMIFLRWEHQKLLTREGLGLYALLPLEQVRLAQFDLT